MDSVAKYSDILIDNAFSTESYYHDRYIYFLREGVSETLLFSICHKQTSLNER